MFSHSTGQGDYFAPARQSDLPVCPLAKFSIGLHGYQTTPATGPWAADAGRNMEIRVHFGRANHSAGQRRVTLPAA